MSFDISFGLVCLRQFESVSDQHRMVQNTQTYKWMDGMGWMGWMGWLSLYDGLLRAPTVLIMALKTMHYGRMKNKQAKSKVDADADRDGHP